MALPDSGAVDPPPVPLARTPMVTDIRPRLSAANKVEAVELV